MKVSLFYNCTAMTWEFMKCKIWLIETEQMQKYILFERLVLKWWFYLAKHKWKWIVRFRHKSNITTFFPKIEIKLSNKKNIHKSMKLNRLFLQTNMFTHWYRIFFCFALLSPCWFDLHLVPRGHERRPWTSWRSRPSPCFLSVRHTLVRVPDCICVGGWGPSIKQEVELKSVSWSSRFPCAVSTILNFSHISCLFSFRSSAPLSSSSLLLLLLDSLTASSVDVLNAVNIVSLALWISAPGLTRPGWLVPPQLGQHAVCPSWSWLLSRVVGWRVGDKRGGKVQLASFTLLCLHLGNCTYLFCFFFFSIKREAHTELLNGSHRFTGGLREQECVLLFWLHQIWELEIPHLVQARTQDLHHLLAGLHMGELLISSGNRM